MPIPDPSQYEALREGAAFFRGLGSDWLRLTGSDRARFANGLVTCDLRNLAAGEGAYGFFTDPKGKIIADGGFLATEDELWVELPEGRGALIAGHLRKYVVADQVDIEEADLASIRLVGPRVEEWLAREADLAGVLGGWAGGKTATVGDEVLVRGDLRLGSPGAVVACPRDRVATLGDALLASGLAEVEEPAVAAVRLEAGIPWFARDFASEVVDGHHETGEGFFPQETGIGEWGVSYEKGCYLGQEVIARIHFRGKVNRLLRGLVFEPGAELPSSTGLTHAGETVGHAGSLAFSPRLDRPVGLAIVHRKVPPEAELSTEHGPCRLVELPFGTAGSV